VVAIKHVLTLNSPCYLGTLENNNLRIHPNIFTVYPSYAILF